MFNFIKDDCGMLYTFKNGWTVTVRPGRDCYETHTETNIEIKAVEVVEYYESSSTKIHKLATPEEVAKILYMVSKR